MFLTYLGGSRRWVLLIDTHILSEKGPTRSGPLERMGLKSLPPHQEYGGGVGGATRSSRWDKIC